MVHSFRLLTQLSSLKKLVSQYTHFKVLTSGHWELPFWALFPLKTTHNYPFCESTQFSSLTTRVVCFCFFGVVFEADYLDPTDNAAFLCESENDSNRDGYGLIAESAKCLHCQPPASGKIP